MEGGEVALLDCGQVGLHSIVCMLLYMYVCTNKYPQVKQINTKQRINLASLIIMVNQWEQLNSKLGQLKSLAHTSHGNNNNELSG